MFDVSQLNENNLPWRWRRIGEWMLDEGKDFSSLDENYAEVLRVAGGSDYGTSRPAITNVSVASASAGSVAFNISTYDDDTPVTWDMSKSVNTYPNGAATPSTAETDITVSGGQWTDSSGPAAGEHAKYVFAATDSDGVEGPLAAVEVVIAPAAVTVAGVDGTDGTASVSWTPATGAASETLYWMEVTGGETAQDVVDSGTAISSPDDTGEVVSTGVGDFGFVVVSTNPGGSSLSAVETVTVTA